MRLVWIGVTFIACCTGFPSTMAAGQANAPGIWIPNARPTPFSKTELSPKQLRALNEQRQKTLVADTERLLQIARELNRDLASSAQVPTERDRRRIAQIEKLAHDVKEKMSQSFTGGPKIELFGPPQMP